MPLWYSTVDYRSYTCHCNIQPLHIDPRHDNGIFTVLQYSTVKYTSNSCHCVILPFYKDPLTATVIFSFTYRSSTCHCDILPFYLYIIPVTMIFTVTNMTSTCTAIFYCYFFIQYLPMWYSIVTYWSNFCNCNIQYLSLRCSTLKIVPILATLIFYCYI